MATENVPKKDIKMKSEDDRYDFTHLSFEELFKAPVVEMSFRGEPLAGPDFFELDFLSLQITPVYLPGDKQENLANYGSDDEVTDDSFDFLELSFEELMRVPVRVSKWQEGDTVNEPDFENLSLEDLMRLPVRRIFIADLDPDALNNLMGEDAFSDLTLSDGGTSDNSGNPLLYVGFGNLGNVSDTSPPIDNGNDTGNIGGSGGDGFTPPPPPPPPTPPPPDNPNGLPSIFVSVSAPADPLIVDESHLALNVTANFADNFTIISSFGTDGAGSLAPVVYTLSTLGGNSGLIDVETNQSVLLKMSGNDIIGYYNNGLNDVMVFKLLINNQGQVTLDQMRALKHFDITNPDDSITLSANNLISITASRTIFDSNGDSATGSASINIGTALSFKDDGPSIMITAVGTADLLSVDETNLAVNATANFADNFTITPNFGADGSGSLTTVYSLSTLGGNSGLVDMASGQNVILILNNGVVEGRTQTGNDLVFAVSVNASGNVMLDQIRALNHPDISNPDDAVTLNAANLITLTATSTITDKDGDSATSSASINIGTALSFKDDGPSIMITAVGTADLLNVDETNLAVNATANFADNFTITPNFGADGSGSLTTVYSLSTLGGNSGFVDMASGQNVILILNNGVVEGRTQTGNDLVFTVSVNASGNVMLDQIRALNHPDISNPDDTVTLNAANLITLTATSTITDKDGDSATSSASINIGTALSFKDDGPSITTKTDPDSDNIIEIAANNFDANINLPLVNWVYGTDGAASFNPIILNTSSGSGSIVLSGTSTQSILTFKDASNVTVATLTLNANGNDNLIVVNRPTATESDILLSGKAMPGGASSVEYIISTIADLRIQITGSDGNATPNQSTDALKANNNGWGIGQNTSVNLNESIKFDFIDNSDFPTITAKPIQQFTFVTGGFTGNGAFAEIEIRVQYADLTFETFTKTASAGEVVNVNNLLGFNTGSLINSVEIKSIDTNNGFRINSPVVSVQSLTPPPDLDYSFSLQIVDKDGDFVTQDFTLHLDGAQPLSSPGYTVDGPIAGATVFQDTNNNAMHDLNESFTISDQVGAYTIILIDTNLDGVIDSHDGRLVSFGGLDIETNLQYNIPLFAPLGSEIISPLSSILFMQLNSEFDLNNKNQALVENLGLLPGTDLTKLNPFDAAYHQGDLTSLSLAAAVMTLSVQLSDAFGAKLGVPQAKVADEIYEAIGDQILTLPKGTIADFTQSDFLQAIVNNTATRLGLNTADFDPIMNLIIESQIAIRNSVNSILPKEDSIMALSEVQHYTQGNYAQAINQFYSGALPENQLSALTKSLHDYNQGNGSLNEISLDLSATNASLPLVNVGEVITDLHPSNDSQTVFSSLTESSNSGDSTLFVTTESEPAPFTSIEISIESTHLPPPTQPLDNF